MGEHTKTPWMAASKYSSMVGVPIVNQQGKRVGNTALPDMPPEWDHLKRQAEIDAAFIVKAINEYSAHEAVALAALEMVACDIPPSPQTVQRLCSALNDLAKAKGSSASVEGSPNAN